MATVTIRLDDDAREDLEEIARTRGVTLSDLVRDQIDGLLGRDVEMRDDVPHALSFPQRALLAQQREILAQLPSADEDESQHHRTMAEVLREGYTMEYGTVFGAMQPEMPRSECKLVRDILNMFRVLDASIGQLSAGDRATLGDENERRLRFSGFDLNDSREARMLGYVGYLVATGRWSEIRPRLEEIGDDGNSHSPYLPTYERMLAVYRPIHEARARESFGLSYDASMFTVDELKKMAIAWAWPGQG